MGNSPKSYFSKILTNINLTAILPGIFPGFYTEMICSKFYTNGIILYMICSHFLFAQFGNFIGLR